jgi:hypothetical protein
MVKLKRGFYKRVVDDLHDRLDVRRENIFVSLIGTGREDWSFGNGDASLSSAVAEAPRIG